jgi:hemin uptake protein HemP
MQVAHFGRAEMTEARQHENEPSASTKQQSSRPRIVNSQELLRGEQEIYIAHQGDTYRLRRTRQGKLILYK